MLTLRMRMVLYVLAVAALTAAAAIWYGLRGQDRLVRTELERVSRGSGVLLARQLAEPMSRVGGRQSEGTAVVEEAVREWVSKGVFTRITVQDPLGNRIAHAMVQEPPEPVRRGVWSLVFRVWSVPEDSELLVWEAITDPDGERLGVLRAKLPTSSDALSPQSATMRGVGIGAAALGVATLITAVLAGRVTSPLGRMTRSVTGLVGEKFDGRLTDGEAPPGVWSPLELRGSMEMAALAHSINRVAERLKSLSELQASTQEKSNFINNVVESMVATLIVVDREARIRALNQATVDLLGYQAEELVGKSSSLICVADGFHLTSSRLEQLLGQGSMKDHEVAFISKDNRHLPVSLSGSAIKDSRGRITGYVCIGTDIQQRKQAEAEKQKLNSQLVATSRQAGMAEVATGVLHNVGNVLNSINVSASVVEETLRKSKVVMVKQVADLLGAHESDLGAFMSGDEKGKMVPGYLSKLAAHLAEEQAGLLGEIKALTSHVGHVKDIISLQQSVSKTAGVVEPVALRDLVEEAMRLVAATLSKYRIEVVREYTEVPQVRTDKHKVLQILVNLLTNAADAMKDTVEKREARLTLRIRRHTHDPRPGSHPGAGASAGPCLRVEVEDNGVGIPPEHVGRIFTHGFTTKKKGHGFGLHSSALSARDLQGSLTLASPGPDRGATFTLVLPVEPAAATERDGVPDAGVPAGGGAARTAGGVVA